MIIIYHQNNIVTEIYDLQISKSLPIIKQNISEELFYLADLYKDRFLIWCNTQLKDHLHKEALFKIFHHKLIMASFNISKDIFNSKIGYIEQSTFVKVPKENQFGTWQMSCDVGGIHALVVNKYKHLKSINNSFKFLLNYISKQGILNGLFCFSDPSLLKNKAQITSFTSLEVSNAQLFKFVHDNYKPIWSSLLLIQLFFYEKKITLFSFIKSKLSTKIDKTVNFSDIEIVSTKKPTLKENFSIDVIIPTLKRKQNLKDVLLDLNKQTLIPKKIIIVEQNPDINSSTELDYLNDNWNFKIDHTFIHQLGACNARNLALSKVTGNWVFFADDDIRFDRNLLEDAFKKINKSGADAIVMSCLQKEEKKTMTITTLSSIFGSGCSIVKSNFSNKSLYKKEHEFGNGEDSDYGMQLRYLGANIIYEPTLKMLHLKAPIGGFRAQPILAWEDDNPKPSPTVMAFYLKHSTHEQLLGYKTLLFLKYYSKQTIKNPYLYFKSMKRRWNISVNWANKLMNDED